MITPPKCETCGREVSMPQDQLEQFAEAGLLYGYHLHCMPCNHFLNRIALNNQQGYYKDPTPVREYENG